MEKIGVRYHLKPRFCLVLILLNMIPAAWSAGSVEESPVRIGTLPLLYAAPLLLAQEDGFFFDEGVGVEIHIYRSFAELQSDLQNGKLDGAVIGITTAISVIQEGADLRIVSYAESAYGLYATRESGIQDLEGLAQSAHIFDLAIGEYAGSDYIAEEFFTRAGISLEEITLTIQPEPFSRLNLLEQGDISLAVLPQPLGSVAQSRGMEMVIDSGVLDIETDVFVFTESALLRGESVGKFLRAYNRTVQTMNGDDRWIQLLADQSGDRYSAGELANVAGHQFDLSRIPTRNDISSINFWMYEQGILERILLYENTVGMLPPRFQRELAP